MDKLNDYNRDIKIVLIEEIILKHLSMISSTIEMLLLVVRKDLVEFNVEYEDIKNIVVKLVSLGVIVKGFEAKCPLTNKMSTFYSKDLKRWNEAKK